MTTLVSTAARNASLAMSYGPNRGTSSASSLEVALFNGDPDNGGVELDPDGGYFRVTLPNDGTTWPDAPADGSITSAPIEFAASTGAFSDTADHFQIYDADTGDAWDCGRLSEEINVEAAGASFAIQATVYYSSGDGS